jgi:hypothetical protein
VSTVKEPPSGASFTVRVSVPEAVVTLIMSGSGPGKLRGRRSTVVLKPDAVPAVVDVQLTVGSPVS